MIGVVLVRKGEVVAMWMVRSADLSQQACLGGILLLSLSLVVVQHEPPHHGNRDDLPAYQVSVHPFCFNQ